MQLRREGSTQLQGRLLSKVPTMPRRTVRAVRVRTAQRPSPLWFGTRPAPLPAPLCAASRRRRVVAAAAGVTTQAVAVRFMFPNARVRCPPPHRKYAAAGLLCRTSDEPNAIRIGWPVRLIKFQLTKSQTAVSPVPPDALRNG